MGLGIRGTCGRAGAARLARDHTVVVPDLRGMGLSSHPAGGYDKKTEAGDVRAVLTELGIDHADVVGHDIGTMVAFAYAERYPEKTDRLVVMDALVPGFRRGMRLCGARSCGIFRLAGRMRSGWWRGGSGFTWIGSGMSLRGITSKIDEATRVHYAELYAKPRAMHSAFTQFLSFPQDAEDNRKWIAAKLTMPVLAVGGAKSFGAEEAVVMQNAACRIGDRRSSEVADSGHWLMERAMQRAAIMGAVAGFLRR